MSDAPRTYRFVVDALSPDRVPMARLAEYIADLARLFGYKEHVHFDRVEQGSLVAVQQVEQEYAPLVHERLSAANNAEGVPDDVADAVESLNHHLAKDGATGSLRDDAGEVIKFPGRDKPPPQTFGPFKQPCTFDGVLIRVGGKDDTVPVHLQAGDAIHICNSTRDMARRLAPHLYRGTLRVWGDGRWERESDGRWKLIRFDISKFEELDDAPIDEVVQRLREVKDSGWRQFDDPLAEIQRLRGTSDEDE